MFEATYSVLGMRNFPVSVRYLGFPIAVARCPLRQWLTHKVSRMTAANTLAAVENSQEGVLQFVIKVSELNGCCKCDYDSSYSTKDAMFDLEQEGLVYVGVPSRRISSCILGSSNTRLLQLQTKVYCRFHPQPT
jgi:hypothetical protein